jgi:hypothetical protein
MGFGVENIGGYIDPGYEPGLFLEHLPQRMITLLGGQLSGTPPELSVLLHPFWRSLIVSLFLLVSLLCLAVFLPVIRQDKAARFWFLAMLFALVPAATVVPLSKNLAFVAVGAFGLLAAFLRSVFSDRSRQRTMHWRFVTWFIAICLLLAHIPASFAARLVMAARCSKLPSVIKRCCSFSRFDIGGHDVVIVNNPCLLTSLATPFVRAYYSEPLPASLRTLLPGNTGFRMTRQTETSLVVEAEGSDVFACDNTGPAHLAYALQFMNEFLAGESLRSDVRRVVRRGFVTEVLEVSERGLPRKIVFHFDKSLDSPNIVWIRFEWATLLYCPFQVPSVGKSVELEGPRSSRPIRTTRW